MNPYINKKVPLIHKESSIVIVFSHEITDEHTVRLS